LVISGDNQRLNLRVTSTGKQTYALDLTQANDCFIRLDYKGFLIGPFSQ